MKTRTIVLTSGILGVILLVISLFLWFAFVPIYSAILSSNLILSATSEGIWSQATAYWARPPMHTTINFYIFNVTNTEEVMYTGAKPALVEVGPFVLTVDVKKKDVKFSEDGDSVYYKNNQKFYFASELSCDICRGDAALTIPNPVSMALLMKVYADENACSSTCRTLADIMLLLLGEYPFRTSTFLDITFNGYSDPMLSLVHSKIFDLILKVFDNGTFAIVEDVPEMQKMAFFYGYNDSSDEDYIIKTGKTNKKEIGTIMKWAGSNLLSNDWWANDQARKIVGTDSGSFTPIPLEKNTVLPFFHSLTCRSYTAKATLELEVNGIPSYRYEVPYEEFDTTLEMNMGYRYSNNERVDYFKNWNPCTNESQRGTQNCSSIDCTIKKNFCNPCCDGKYVNHTYLLPPGMFPLVCYPGRNCSPPFSALISPPHWYYSPKDARESVIGLDAQKSRHAPFIFDREARFGTLLHAEYRVMVSLPMTRGDITISRHFPNVFVPTFWLETNANLHKDIQDQFYNIFRLPFIIVTYVKIITLALAIICLFIAFAVYLKFRKSQTRIEPSSL